MRKFHYQDQTVQKLFKDYTSRRNSSQILKLCLYGPHASFYLAAATRETSVMQNCTGLVAEKSTVTSGLYLNDKPAFIKRRTAIPNNLSSKVNYFIHVGLVVMVSFFVVVGVFVCLAWFVLVLFWGDFFCLLVWFGFFKHLIISCEKATTGQY